MLNKFNIFSKEYDPDNCINLFMGMFIIIPTIIGVPMYIIGGLNNSGVDETIDCVIYMDGITGMDYEVCSK